MLRACVLFLVGFVVGCGDSDMAEIRQSIGETLEGEFDSHETDEPPRTIEKPVVAEADVASLQAIIDSAFEKLEREPGQTTRPEPDDQQDRARKWLFETIHPKPLQPVVLNGKSRGLLQFSGLGRVSPLMLSVPIARSFLFEGPEKNFQFNYSLIFELEDSKWRIVERKWELDGARVSRPVEDETIHADFLDWIFADALVAQDAGEQAR